MPRFFFSRPFNYSLRVNRRLRGLVATFVLCAVGATSGFATSGLARADEFSQVPTGDPIYRQLRSLDSADPTVARVSSGLTRYEAALQVARIITRVSNDNSAQLSRVGWRALRDLSQSLKSELVQLGIDVAAAQKLADARLKAPEARATESDNSARDLSVPSSFDGASRNFPISIARGAAGDTLLSGAGLQPAGTSLASGLQSSAFSASIVPRLRVGAALIALQRAENDPFNSSGAGHALLTSGSETRVLGSNTSIDYDVTSWLSVRAQSSQRALANMPTISPILRDSFFDNATETRSAGGGLGIDVGALSFNTRIEQLSTDAGARGTSAGGGVSLSAWQNRLSLSAHLARLQPEDRAVLPSTRTELGIDLNVSQRLSLSLFYQGLFTQQKIGNSERVAGGLNLSF